MYAMRTNIVLGENLIRETMRLSGARTKRAVVDFALRELVTRGKQKHFLMLAGQDLIAPDYDVRQIRRRSDQNSN